MMPALPAGTEKGWQGRQGRDASAVRHRDLVLGSREEGCLHLTQTPGFLGWSVAVVTHTGDRTKEDLDCGV